MLLSVDKNNCGEEGWGYKISFWLIKIDLFHIAILKDVLLEGA